MLIELVNTKGCAILVNPDHLQAVVPDKDKEGIQNLLFNGFEIDVPNGEVGKLMPPCGNDTFAKTMAAMMPMMMGRS